MEGIQPIGQSTVLESADFPLVGSGIQTNSLCGSFFTLGCLETWKHDSVQLPEGISHQKQLDGSCKSGQAYLKRVAHHCDKPLCPICCKHWAQRETARAMARLEAFSLKGKTLKPIHLIVSVPKRLWCLPEPKLRHLAYLEAKKCRFLGGMVIYHSRRKNDMVGWYFSPHFHMVGYGWIQGTDRNYSEGRWIVKNAGVRKTVQGTIMYQLSHAGINPSGKAHSITWFGALAYNKLRVPKELEGQKPTCPLCGERLRELVWLGKGCHGLPDLEDFSCVGSSEGWAYAPPKFWGRLGGETFE